MTGTRRSWVVGLLTLKHLDNSWSSCINQWRVFIYTWDPLGLKRGLAWMGREFGRVATCIRMLQSLGCPPETITASLIGPPPI